MEPFSFRWLDHNEDDGQIVRELVPAGNGLRLFSKPVLGKKNNVISTLKMKFKLHF